MKSLGKRFIVVLGRILFIGKRTIAPEHPKRILIVKIGAIGDVLMSTPFVRQVRRAYPNAKILYAVGNFSQVVLRGNPHLDEILPFDETIIWKLRLLPLLGLIRRLRAFRADLGFLLDKHYSAAVFGFLSGIRFRVGFDRRGEGFANNRNVPYGPVRHEIEYSLDLLRVLNKPVVGETTRMEVFADASDRKIVEAFVNRYAQGRTMIGLALGGAQNPSQTALLKRWPLRHYIALSRMVLTQNPNAVIVLFGAKSDHDVHAALKRGMSDSSRVIDGAGVLTLQQTVLCMGRCAAIVVHDTGPMHMAAASGAPVISLSGPVHPGRTAPIGAQHTNIIKLNAEGALCYDDEGTFPKNVRELPCMAEIRPEDIYSVLQRYGCA